MGFRGSGGLPLDSQHPGDSFPQSFSPRSSISTLFDPFLMILDVSEAIRIPFAPARAIPGLPKAARGALRAHDGACPRSGQPREGKSIASLK